MRPSPALHKRLRFTTKEVGKGFYRGTRTGSVGAHTEYGGYIVDWRKVRHFNVPDLKGFNLKPFVTKEMAPTPSYATDDLGVRYQPKAVDGLAFLQIWKEKNPEEYHDIVDFQRNIAVQQLDAAVQENLRLMDAPIEEDMLAADVSEQTNAQKAKNSRLSQKTSTQPVRNAREPSRKPSSTSRP